MSNHFQCFNPDCGNKVNLIQSDDVKQCPSCGSTNGQIISGQQFKELLNAGAIFEIDPKNQKRNAKARKNTHNN